MSMYCHRVMDGEVQRLRQQISVWKMSWCILRRRQRKKLVISVTKEGLHTLLYSAPRVVSEILAYPIEILPFEKLMERFDQYIVMHGYDDEKTINIEINRIQLGMMDLKIADERSQIFINTCMGFLR